MLLTHQIITGDLYDISSRIKEIDSSYFIARNNKTKKIEVHADNKQGSSLCLVLPFDRLDNRTLVHTRRTRVERAKQLLAEAEKENVRLEKQEAERILKKVMFNAQ
ncbi:MAG: hypothetical protein FWE13_02350 [Firmicutes bacterium]|nr:hypothetical protein [Bacillota bacterium]